jgi:hypothetical protein
MQVSEINGLGCGSPVWTWMVRSGEGQWWPGIVQSIGVVAGAPSISVRFECHSLRRARSRSTTFVGISTTQIRYLERREMNGKELDRPKYVPRH